MQTDFESMNVGMFWGDMESILFLKKKKYMYVCVCVSSFPIKRNNKKESEKKKERRS